MSSCEITKITCSTCAVEQEVTLWNSVNTSLNPEMKSKVLSQEILRIRCSGCHEILMTGYPLLYHDMEGRLMIFLSNAPIEQTPEPPPFIGDYRLRAVRIPDHLVEKILVFDAALDDRAIEAIKVGACHELVRTYGSTMQKFGALPLDASSLLFVGTLPAKSGEPSVAKLLFLLLLHAQPRFPMFVMVEFAEYTRLSARLEKMPKASGAAGKWCLYDFEWARSTFDLSEVAIQVEIILSPELLLSLPAAKSLWQRHAEVYHKVPAKNEPSTGLASRIRKWFH